MMALLGGARVYIALAVVAALLGSHWYVYEKGKGRERDKAAAAALAFREKEQKLIAELDAAKQKREVIYRDKIKIVKESDDACLDAPLPADVDRVLRSLNGSPERGSDSGLPPSSP